ncbi:MAG: NUDIX hydrolase [Rhizorhabdus sp.]
MSDRPVPAVPRSAATILVLRDDPFEVLMVRRHGGDQFASALIFPGGQVDADDRDDGWLPYVAEAGGCDPVERALRIAACRETFEEAGLLLARDEGGASVPCPVATDAPFRDLVAASGGRLSLDDLVHFGHWITPEGAPKRYDTHFFLARAPGGQDAICDGSEAVALEWVAPRDVMARAAAGDLSILFPTRMNLKRLAESQSVDDAIAAARLRPRFTVLPRPERQANGIVVRIPQEAGYGETENFHPFPPRAG